jgi:hypothetical protein
MAVEYTINVPAAEASVPCAGLMSSYGASRLAELTEKLQALTEDVRLTAEDLICILTVHSQCCLAVTEQALVYVNEDGDLPKFGGLHD